MADLLAVHPHDTVALALRPLKRGETFFTPALILQEDIPLGHKVALKDIAPGEKVLRYGASLGRATRAIRAGEWVHTHNLASALGEEPCYTYSPRAQEIAPGPEGTFMGYLRPDGRGATRNQVWILPTVSCVNETVRKIADRAAAAYGHLCDGIVALPHNGGCSQLGDDLQNTRQVLAALASHPNAGGVLLVGLGCENNRLEDLLPLIHKEKGRLACFNAQDTEDELALGVRLAGELAQTIAQDRRQPVSLSHLCLGMKCGGSDSLSGVTANPLCGCITDRLTAAGGRVVMTEVPEMFGAEQILMDRAVSPAVFEDIRAMILAFRAYYTSHGQPVYENPSPGNKEGGITTLEEKSLGCIQKGGRAPVTAVLAPGEPAAKAGLSLLTGPGNDNISLTLLLAAGATAILFTTGRGTPLGTVCPTLKISTNSPLAARKPGWIDFDGGRLLSGESLEELTEELWQHLLACASGRPARNEQNDDRQIMVFRQGVVL